MAKRHIVCLTFDFDAISGFIARGQTTASWISRGEFGAHMVVESVNDGPVTILIDSADFDRPRRG